MEEGTIEKMQRHRLNTKGVSRGVAAWFQCSVSLNWDALFGRLEKHHRFEREGLHLTVRVLL